MIRLVEALNYRCLKYIRRPLNSFHILVGPNASGKTTFLDVIAFLGQIVAEGPEEAVAERTENFRDLIWGRKEEICELAIEAEIPETRRKKLNNPDMDTIRFEIRLGVDEKTKKTGIFEERLLLKKHVSIPAPQRGFFPEYHTPPTTIISGRAKSGGHTILSKTHEKNDNFYSEIRTGSSKHGWFPSIRLGPQKSTLASLPNDEEKFPVSIWFKHLLVEGVQKLMLNSQFIRKPSSPEKVSGFKPDGSNLSWVIRGLKKNKKRFHSWLEHIRTALPDIVDIKTIVRPEDKHCYLMVCYKGGLELPSWMISDGTLRLLALTLPAYMPEMEGIYLIEEPENGIHPRASETVYQSLSSVYNAQILLATHSPVILSQAKISDVLCFKKDSNGITDIVLGSEHPELQQWKKEPNLGVLFAGGVLG